MVLIKFMLVLVAFHTPETLVKIYISMSLVISGICNWQNPLVLFLRTTILLGAAAPRTRLSLVSIIVGTRKFCLGEMLLRKSSIIWIYRG